MRRWSFETSLLLLLSLPGPACTTLGWQAQHTPMGGGVVAQDIDPQAPFLKVHLTDGSVYVLTRWRIDERDRLISGEGVRYDVHRAVLGEGSFEVPFDGVGVLETNRPEEVRQNSFAVMAVATGASLAVTALCVVSPKSCFGSCPTFYTGEGEDEVLHAEGFSASIARSLEATDVDALWAAEVGPGPFDLHMRNEALETQVVAHTALLVAPRPEGGRVIRAGDRFFQVDGLAPVATCEGDAGHCADLVAEPDGEEYRSFTDGEDLGRREWITATLPPSDGPRALVLRARTTLLSTFLFYQSLAYMGDDAGRFMLRLEYGLPQQKDLYNAFLHVLGDIDVEVETPDGWVEVGAFTEHGPIAREVQMLPLPDEVGDGPLNIRLNLTRGNWRLDWLAQARVGAEVTPVRVSPSQVLVDGVASVDALARLNTPGEYLYTWPGDHHTLRFELPAEVADPELFLESRGYYYEWMRDQWLPEKDPERAVRMLVDGEAMLRELAPAFAEREADLDEVFWSSRFRRTP